jgi:hypothetical protein
MDRYTLITSTGRLYTFSVLECALVYQNAYGGVVFSQQVLQTVEA